MPPLAPAATFLANLNSLRGVAALLVLLFHIELYSELVARHSATDYLHRSYLMVDLFFVLSGFIMCHVYGGRFVDGPRRAAFEGFVAARFARLYPLHLLTLAYFIGLIAFRQHSHPAAWTAQHDVLYAPGAIPVHLLLLQGMNTLPFMSWNDPSWSISTEWWVDLLFPFLVGPLARGGRAHSLAVTMACVGTYLGIMLVLVPRVTVPPEFAGSDVDPSQMTIDVTYQFGFVRCLAGFILGMLVHRAYQGGWGRRLFGGPTALLLTAAIVVCMHRGYPDLLTVAFFPPLVLATAYGGRRIDAVLGARPLQRLGDWSYAIYMIHIPLMQTLFYLLLIRAIPGTDIRGRGRSPVRCVSHRHAEPVRPGPRVRRGTAASESAAMALVGRVGMNSRVRAVRGSVSRAMAQLPCQPHRSVPDCGRRVGSTRVACPQYPLDDLVRELDLDPRYFDQWGVRIASGDWLGDRVFFVDPLYPYVLGVTYRLFGHDLLLVRLIQVAFDVGTVLLVAELGRRVAGPGPETPQRFCTPSTLRPSSARARSRKRR